MKKKYLKKDIASISYVSGIIWFLDGNFITKKEHPELYYRLIK